MAKTKGRPPNEPDVEEVLSSQALRGMAQELESLAEQLAGYANDMDKVGIETLTPQMKNWTNAIKFQEGWIAKQLVPRLVSAANDKGVRIKIQIMTDSKK